MGDTKNAHENDKVLVKFVRWDPPARIPTCKILRVLGPCNDARTDHKGILVKYGLSQNFPDHVEKEAKSFGSSLSKKDSGKTPQGAKLSFPPPKGFRNSVAFVNSS